MQLPPELIRKTIFVHGGAFRKRHEFREEGGKNRFFFILNKNPEKDDRLIVVTATTKIRKRKKRRLSNVLVEITPKEYPSLEKHSIIDCESCYIWRKSIIEKEISKNKIEPLKPLSESMLKRLHAAVGFSRTLTPIDKRLILGEATI